MRNLLDFYLGQMKISVQQQLQYRVANYFYMIGMVAEPVIYLVVWSTIANAQGGSVGGYTAGQFAAYYIVWTLVRNMNIVFTPFGWEWRIREGQLNGMLLRPIHPLHGDIAYFAGWKVAVILMWLPIAAVLAIAFRPELSPTWQEIVVFAIAIWGAYLIRTMLLWLLGMVTFYTTRVAALFELYFAAELLLSGRLVPMSLMPPWVQTVAAWLPFKWAFQFPIEALVGTLPPDQLWGGLIMQALWIAIGGALALLAWQAAIRQYSAVGG
jgi:ABC-2 type transport system permease protein